MNLIKDTAARLNIIIVSLDFKQINPNARRAMDIHPKQNDLIIQGKMKRYQTTGDIEVESDNIKDLENQINNLYKQGMRFEIFDLWVTSWVV